MAHSWEKSEVSNNAHVPLATALAQYPILEVDDDDDRGVVVANL
jgi:hypothetical protein